MRYRRCDGRSPIAFVVSMGLVGAMAIAPVLGVDALIVLFAVIPSMLLLHFFASSDRFPEPPDVILATFWRGILVTIPAVIASIILQPVYAGLFEPFGPVGHAIGRALVGAAIPEEACKLWVLYAYCAQHSHFDEPMDGIVYGVTASLGFATLENVLYVVSGATFIESVEVAIVRSMTAVPEHALLGAIMGAFVGLSMHSSKHARLLLVAAWLIPVGLHAAYDAPLFLMKGSGAGALGLTVFLLVMLAELVIAKRLLGALRMVQAGERSVEAVVARVVGLGRADGSWRDS